MHNWDSTELWTILDSCKGADRSEVCTTLEKWMPKIQSILASGGTSPKDFTLHDSEHSYRVATRMMALIPSDVAEALSDYELALLLLSAYLHDIGMTPAYGKLLSHRSYLLDGDVSSLSEDERAIFQRWLDDSKYALVPPIKRTASVEQVVRLADEIITYYSRARHNDWSEEWIRRHLTSEKLGAYTGWVDDLVALCRSHHEGYEVLVASRFDPRPVTSQADIVHLRYLAAVLRVADVLDVDPERTPETILHHRDIAAESLIYWTKDQEISITLNDNRIGVYARPTRAFVHKAVEDTADAIETELAMCKRLDDTRPFRSVSGPLQHLQHRWDIQPYVYRDIQARSNTYEYINGAFRPNTQRVLELLSGTELYGNSLAGIRECLQNSFDAVREKIAYQRLVQPNPGDASLEGTLGNLHVVRVSLRLEDEVWWLIVDDNGIGMTKSIVKDHLLVSGSPKKREIVELERKCRSAGFALGRTGQFGLGALSYFMLADRVEITTRRAGETNDAEPNGWHFQSDGIGAFGELRRDNSRTAGTEVRMRLRPELLDNGVDIFVEKLRAYLKDTLGRVPCRFELVGVDGSVIQHIPPGWVRRVDDFTRNVGHSLLARELSDELLQSRVVRERRAAQRDWSLAIKERVDRSIRWHHLHGEIPGGFGTYQASIPYFELPGGKSLIFLDTHAEDEMIYCSPVRRGDCIVPHKETRYFWRGIAVGPTGGGQRRRTSINTMERTFGGYLDIDFVSESMGSISVNRSSFVRTMDGARVVREVEAKVWEEVEGFVRTFAPSAYNHVSRCFIGARFDETAPLSWLGHRFVAQAPLAPRVRWTEIVFPHTEHSEEFGSDYSVLRSYPPLAPLVGRAPLFWFNNVFSADRVLISPLYGVADPARRVVLEPALYWEKRPAASVNGIMQAAFPPAWFQLCKVDIALDYASDVWRGCWNLDNPAVRSLDSELWGWARRLIQAATDPLKSKEEILRSRAHAATWLLLYIDSADATLWDGLCERDEAFAFELWDLVFGREWFANGDWLPVYMIEREYPSPGLKCFSPRGAWFMEEAGDICAALPVPSSEWFYGPSESNEVS